MLIGAIALDIKTGKIPNRYNVFWIGLGLLERLLLFGYREISEGLVGILIPVLGLMLLFSAGIIGAGDIKLFGAVGAFVGWDIVWIVAYSFIVCGVYGGILIILRIIRGISDGNIRADLVGVLTRNRRYTRVAFSVFILGGFVWYVVKGGVSFGI